MGTESEPGEKCEKGSAKVSSGGTGAGEHRRENTKLMLADTWKPMKGEGRLERRKFPMPGEGGLYQ